jgi:hypothetical protein
MRNVALAVSFPLLFTGTLLGQSATESRPLSFSLAAGPTRAFRVVDAPGFEAEGGIARYLGHGFGVRVDAASHWYREQPQYPCMVQDADRCYQTMSRSVKVAVLSATYRVSRFSSDNGRSVPYVITGIGTYRGRRLATHYPTCQPSDALCLDRNISKWEMFDTQLGWSGGVGVDFKIGSVPAFVETRLHYIYNDKRGAQPSNDYFLWPWSMGLRF